MDEDNTIELLLQGRVAAGGMPLGDWEELPGEIEEQLTVFGATVTVPRQLVSARPGMEPELVVKLQLLMIGPDDTEAGQHLLGSMKRSRFDMPPLKSETALADSRQLMELTTP